MKPENNVAEGRRAEVDDGDGDGDDDEGIDELNISTLPQQVCS